MPATSPTWRSMRSMLAAWSLLRRAVVQAGKQYLERPRRLQIIFPRGKNQPVHTCSLRPFRRRLCQIRKDPEVGAAEPVAAVAAAAPVEVAQAEEAREGVEPGAAVKVAPAAEARVAAEVVAVAALVEVAQAEADPAA